MIGKAIADFGADWMVWIVLVLLAANILVTLRYPRLERAEMPEKERMECCSLPVFFKRYK